LKGGFVILSLLIKSIHEADLAKDNLCDLRTKEMLHEFKMKGLGEGWCFLMQTHPQLVQ
jgi:hypothetical protein